MRRLSLVLPVLALACGGSSEALSGPGGPSIAADITVEQGADQTAPVGQALPDSVVGRAVDGAGDPVEGRIVNLEVPAGPDAGRFDADALQTNATGRVFAELRTGTRAWTARVRSGEDSAYVARLIASREGRADEIESFTFSVQPGPLTKLTLRPGEAPDYRIGDRLDVLSDLTWPGRDEHGNPIPGSMLRGRSASWTFFFNHPRTGEIRGPAGTGWGMDAVPELHKVGWIPAASPDVDTSAVTPDWPPDSAFVFGELEMSSGTIGGDMPLEVLLPVCWETTPQGKEGFVRFQAVPWTADCPTPEEQVN